MPDETRINIDLVAVENQASAALKLTETQLININIQMAKAKKQASMLNGAFKNFQQTGNLTARVTNQAKQQGNLNVFRQAKKNVATNTMLGNLQYDSTREQALILAHQKSEWDKQAKIRLGISQPVKQTLKFGDSGYKAQRQAELSLQKQKKLLDENLKKQLGIKNAAGGFAKNLGKSLLSFVAIKQAMKFLGKTLAESASWTENLNLFEVTFGKSSASALNFALNVQKAYGIGANEIIRYTGLFKQMSEAIGIAEKTSTEMSTTLTTLGYDIASLYNISTESAMEKLRAGLAGQTKPLRSLGMDITAQSLDKYLGSMGLDYTSKMLNQADKMLLRTIVIVDQAKNSYGDMAKTINTFANQMKVFSGSFENFKLALGDLIIQPATVAITAVNGFVIAMTNIIRAFVPLSKESGLNQTAESIGAVDEATQDLEKTMGLLTFDKFESLSNGEGASGINGMLTEEFAKKQAEYMSKFNEQMALIKNNANDIAKAIQNWIFPNGLITEGKNFLDIFMQLNPILQFGLLLLGAFAAKSIILGVVNIIKSFTSLKSVASGVNLGILGMVAAFSLITTLFQDATPTFKIIVGALFGLVSALIAGTVAWMAFHGTMSAGIAVPIILTAVGAGIAGIMAMTQGIKDVGQFANGGYPDKGQMFIANEAGAELVGNIGGSTAVANNDMIVAAIENAAYRGYIRAMQENQARSGIDQNINLSLDINGREFARATYNDMQAESKRRGAR